MKTSYKKFHGCSDTDQHGIRNVFLDNLRKKVDVAEDDEFRWLVEVLRKTACMA